MELYKAWIGIQRVLTRYDCDWHPDPLGGIRTPPPTFKKGLIVTSFSPLLFLSPMLLIVALTISQWRQPQYQQRPWRAEPAPSSTRQYNAQSNHINLSPDFFNIDIHSSSASPAPFFFADIPSATCPLVDTTFYDSPQPALFPGPALPAFTDTEYQNVPDYPALIGSTATGVDWAALGCLPAPSELSESPNTLETPSVESPDILPNQSSSIASTVSMSAAASLPIPSSASRDESSKGNSSRVQKRQLNTLAARRYRQRRVDRMNELEAELDAIKRERDELKMRVSKLEGETEALRSMIKDKAN